MTARERLQRLEEYWRVQDDLEAILNVPDGMELGWKHFETVRWLENRLRELDKALSERKAS